MYLSEFDDRRRRVAQPTPPVAAPPEPERGSTRDEVRAFFAGRRR